MSGIFGFTTLLRNEDAERYMHPLDIWNRPYGRDGSAKTIIGPCGIGCHLEHLNDRIQTSDPILKRDHILAAIDAVLYNRDELLADLDGALSDAVSDEELLLELVLRRGYPALSCVNGDFSGAVFDTRSRTWTFFRDHSGVRPLFYYLDDSCFAFSTDLRGLTALPNADCTINEERFYLRMAGFTALSMDRTDYRNIRCLLPGTWTSITVTGDQFRIEPHVYWKWGQKKVRLSSDAEYQRELRRLITDAIRRRLDAFPGKAGCELSGGLDSSVIAILINRLGREGAYFSWSYPPESIPLKEGTDERKVIFDICEQEHITCAFAEIDYQVSLDTMLEDIDPPYMNTHYITQGSQYFRSQGTRVVFSGHGGDEGVSHRCNLYELWHHREYLAFFRILYQQTEGLRFRLLRTIKRAWHQIFAVHPEFRKPFRKWLLDTSYYLDQNFIARMSGTVKPGQVHFAYDPAAYIMQGGHRSRLDNVALQGAKNGVRYMLPFIDYRVLDFALSIPRAQYMKGHVNRYIYRAAFADLFPKSLAEVNYKNTPSQADYTPDIDYTEHFRNTKQKLLSCLSSDFWADYIDLDRVRRSELPANYTWEQYRRASGLFNELAICCAIENVARNSQKRSESHE